MVPAGTVMRWEMAERGTPLAPSEYSKFIEVEPAAASDWLGWYGLEAGRYCELPDSEFDRPPSTHHTLILFNRPPDALDLRYEGVKRHLPPAGSVSFVPAGVLSRCRWKGRKDSLHVYLEAGVVTRVASGTFELDPARVTIPPLDGLDLP